MTRAERLAAAAKIADRHDAKKTKGKGKKKPVPPQYAALRKAHDGRPYAQDKV